MKLFFAIPAVALAFLATTACAPAAGEPARIAAATATSPPPPTATVAPPAAPSPTPSPTATPLPPPPEAAPSPEPTSTPLPAPTPTPEAAAVDWLAVEGKTADGRIFLGNPDAPVTIIDYSDFMWSACRSYVLGTEPQLKETYVKTGQVKLVFNPMLDHGDRSVQAHQAAECAAEQSRFWPLHDALFARQGDLWGGDIRQTIKTLAAELDLDAAQLNACIDEQRFVESVTAQDRLRRELGIRTRPTLDINGRPVIGPQAFAILQSVIDPLLK